MEIRGIPYVHGVYKEKYGTDSEWGTGSGFSVRTLSDWEISVRQWFRVTVAKFKFTKFSRFSTPLFCFGQIGFSMYGSLVIMVKCFEVFCTHFFQEMLEATASFLITYRFLVCSIITLTLSHPFCYHFNHLLYLASKILSYWLILHYLNSTNPQPAVNSS